MKSIFAMATVFILAACVSNTEFDRDSDYAKCEEYGEKTCRDRCIADAIKQAERERERENARLEEFQDNADRRELGREIAGAGDG